VKSLIDEWVLLRIAKEDMRTIKILQPVLIVFVVHTIFTVFLLRYYQGDISCLVHAGQTFVNAAEAPRELCQQDTGDGYDGQFNYRFALNPFSNQPVYQGISIDRPIYRYQRIFYPFITWLFTGGNRTLVPAVFVLVNLISICVLTTVSAGYALDLGRNSHWSLALGLYLGFLLSFALDLGHTLEILLLFAGLLLSKQKSFWAVLLFSFAILTRETAVLLAGAALVAAFLQRWKRWYLFLIPVGVFLAWQGFLLWFWRGVPNLSKGESLVFPFTGFLSALTSCWERGDVFGFVLQLLVLGFGLVVLFSLKRSSAPLSIKLAWLLFSALALMMSFDVWVKFNGYLRGLSEWYFLSCLIVFPMLRLPGWLSHLRSPWKTSLPSQ
jgi:hypothetical protein